MDWTIIAPVAISVIGAAASIYTARQQRRKLEAEAGHIEAQGNTAIVGASITLVAPLRQEIATLRDEIEQERTARRADAQKCQNEIQLRDTEITILKRELNRLNRKMNAHEASIKKLKSDTDDLATRTPPPHAIPADPTPPIPTRGTYGDITGTFADESNTFADESNTFADESNTFTNPPPPASDDPADWE